MASFRNGNRVMLVIIIIFISPFCVFSQQSIVSLSALNDSADHYLPRLLEKRALVKGASAYVTETRNQFLPSVRFNDQVNIGSDNSVAGSYYPYSIIPSTSSGIRDANDYQAVSGNLAILYGEYDLVDFGYKNARIGYAKSEQAFSSSDLQREMYILHGRICRAYFHLMINEARMNVEKETVKRYDTIFSVIRALTMSGIKPGSDSSLAKAELSKSRITYNQIDEQAKNDREEISYLTGITTGRITADSNLMSIENKKGIDQIPSDSSINPLLDYYNSLNKVYIANERLISKSYLPKISLSAASWARGSSIVYDDQYKSLSQGFGYQRFNYLAGISFQYDLFNEIHKKDRLKTFGFERDASELELKQQEINLASAARQAQNSIDIAEKNLLELPVQYKAAMDTYNQKIAQYKAGIITLIDLTNAAFVLDRALNDYAETRGNWWLARLDKAIATGQLAAFIQTIQ